MGRVRLGGDASRVVAVEPSAKVCVELRFVEWTDNRGELGADNARVPLPRS